MPELPEVEICRRNLARWARGKTLTAVDVRDPGAIRGDWSTRPSHALEGGPAAIEALVGGVADEPIRHGKRLGWAFGSQGLLIHLGMSGAWGQGEPEKYGRLGLQFGDDWLWFRDMRRFGCVVPCPTADLKPRLEKGHGPDGLLAPPDGEKLAANFATAKAIKVALLDQHRIAGVGNIHAVEALWRIGLHPATPSNQLRPDQWSTLASAVRDQLAHAIATQDGEDFTYITEGGPNVFSVYGREGEPCERCAAPIERSVQGGRATFHCPRCQPG